MNLSQMLQPPRISLETDDKRSSLTAQYLALALPELETDFGRAVRERMKNDPIIKNLINQRVNGQANVDPKSAALWFVSYSLIHGEEAAENALENWLNAEEVEIGSALWYIGGHFEKSVELGEGYAIMLIDDMPPSDEKQACLLSNLSDFWVSRAYPRAAIIRKYKIKRLLPLHEPRPDEMTRSEAEIRDIGALLGAVSGGSCIPIFQTDIQSNEHLPGWVTGRGASTYFPDVRGGNGAWVTLTDVSQLKSLIADFRKLPTEQKDRMRTLLRRLSQAKERTDLPDKFLDLGIVLEMGLIAKSEVSQISFELALRGSWLIGESSEERLTIFKELKDLYKLRSKVAHTGVMSEGHNVLLQKIPGFVSLVERIVRKIVAVGFLKDEDWKKMLLGSS